MCIYRAIILANLFLRRSVLAVWMLFFILSWKMARCGITPTSVHVATLLSMEGGTLP